MLCAVVGPALWRVKERCLPADLCQHPHRSLEQRTRVIESVKDAQFIEIIAKFATQYGVDRVLSVHEIFGIKTQRWVVPRICFEGFLNLAPEHCMDAPEPFSRIREF